MKRKLSSVLLSALLLFVLPTPGQTAQNPNVILTWNASATPGATYQVYREQTAGACTLTSTGTGPGCLLLNATPLTALTFTDTTASYNSTVFYIVKASAAGLTSAFSNEVTAVIPQAPVAPFTITCTVQVSGTVVTGSTCK